MNKQQDDGLTFDDPIEEKFYDLFMERATEIAIEMGLNSVNDLPQRTMEVIALENVRRMHAVRPLKYTTPFLLDYLEYCEIGIERHAPGVLTVDELPEDGREALALGYLDMVDGKADTTEN